MPDIKTKYILILDVGKTHSKVTLVDLLIGNIQISRTTSNKSLKQATYKALDIEAIWDWFLSQLAELNHAYPVAQITVTTHGAAAALINDSGDENTLIFPVMDYEDNHLDEVKEQYIKIRPPFSETGSMDLPQGLNLGRQLFWLHQKYPYKWKQVKYILMLPQYFCWRLSGIAVSEITSLGCHTDLWDLVDMKLSSMVYKCNWQHLFPEIRKPGAILATIKKSLANRLNLSADIEILNGIHDSNATLYPYLKATTNNCNIISSGTWVVINHINNQSSPENMLTPLNLPDSLSNGIMFSVNALNDTVSSIRFMGGREWSLIQQNTITDCSLTDIQFILSQQVFPLPSFEKSGPFAEHKGCFYFRKHNFELDKNTLSALATIYLVLMSRYCLDQLNVNCKDRHPADTIVEGAFVKNKIYLQLLQTLSLPEKIFYSSDETGTTSGASRLSHYANNWPPVNLTRVKSQTMAGFSDYYLSWCTLVDKMLIKPHHQPEK